MMTTDFYVAIDVDDNGLAHGVGLYCDCCKERVADADTLLNDVNAAAANHFAQHVASDDYIPTPAAIAGDGYCRDEPERTP